MLNEMFMDRVKHEREAAVKLKTWKEQLIARQDIPRSLD